VQGRVPYQTQQQSLNESVAWQGPMDFRQGVNFFQAKIADVKAKNGENFKMIPLKRSP